MYLFTKHFTTKTCHNPLSAMLSLTGFFNCNITTVYYAQGREITNRPSDKDRMGVKTLGWWVVKA
jgi:hypothetical protein